MRRGTQPVLLARLRAGGGRAGAGQVGAPFTDRLVEKFGLPVTGWRGRGAASRESMAGPETTGRAQDEEPGGDA